MSKDPKRLDPSDIVAYIGLVLMIAAGTATVTVGIFKVIVWMLK